MSDVVKPVIPREVADAIESRRADGRSNAQIAEVAFRSGGPAYPGRFTQNAQIIRDFAAENPDTLLAALVNGYEVEKTAEEAAYERIRNTYSRKYRAVTYGVVSDRLTNDVGFADGIKYALNELGVKIPGVNAPEGVNA